MRTSCKASLCVALLAAIVGCGSTGADGSGKGSPVGTWKISPVPGVDATDGSVTRSWEFTIHDDMTYAFTFISVFAPNASSFPGCTYSLTSSGGTWASVTVNGSSRFRITALQTHTVVRTGCVQASQNFALRPTKQTETDPVMVVAGDYPYVIDGSVMTLTTGQGAYSFTHE